MSLFKDIWAWLKKEFKYITQDVDKVAISATQQIKQAVESSEVGFIAKIVDGVSGTGLATEAVAIIKLAAMKALSIELAIQFPTGGIDPNSQEFLDWEQKILEAFGINHDKSVVWSRVAATIVRDIQAFTQDGSAVSFAEAVKIVEDAYQASK